MAGKSYWRAAPPTRAAVFLPRPVGYGIHTSRLVIPDAERCARRRSGTQPPRVGAANEVIGAAGPRVRGEAPARSRLQLTLARVRGRDDNVRYVNTVAL
jgi:hypothetical protein